MNKNGFEKSQSQLLSDEYDEYSDPTLSFERNRIKQLQDERVHIQKKTFTKWCNSFLNRVSLLKKKKIFLFNNIFIIFQFFFPLLFFSTKFSLF